ncbi:MAG: hypothetical protein LBD41_00365, partial [Clostridiales Family XIII bacterium]|nr:hypothetical protein [Clostridiales Family XIII bacterium]
MSKWLNERIKNRNTPSNVNKEVAKQKEQALLNNLIADRDTILRQQSELLLNNPNSSVEKDTSTKNILSMDYPSENQANNGLSLSWSQSFEKWKKEKEKKIAEEKKRKEWESQWLDLSDEEWERIKNREKGVKEFSHSKDEGYREYAKGKSPLERTIMSDDEFYNMSDDEFEKRFKNGLGTPPSDYHSAQMTAGEYKEAKEKGITPKTEEDLLEIGIISPEYRDAFYKSLSDEEIEYLKKSKTPKDVHNYGLTEPDNIVRDIKLIDVKREFERRAATEILLKNELPGIRDDLKKKRDDNAVPAMLYSSYELFNTPSSLNSLIEYRKSYDTPENREKYDRWGYYKVSYNMVNRAYEKLNSPLPREGTITSTLKGAKNYGMDLRFWTFGLSSLTDYSVIKKVADKSAKEEELNDAEKSVLDALFYKGQVDMLRENNMSIWYKGGEITMESVPFMVEFLATAGIGAVVQQGVLKGAEKVILKGVEKHIRKKLEQKIGKEAAESAIKRAEARMARRIESGVEKEVAEKAFARESRHVGHQVERKIERDLGKEMAAHELKFAKTFENPYLKGAVDVVAGAPARSPFMPSFWGNIGENMTPHISGINKDGSYVIEDGMNPLDATLSALGEVNSEMAGGLISPALGKFLNWFGRSNISRNVLKGNLNS